MRNSAWNGLISLIEGKYSGPKPVGFIIDSPWIPGWFGISRTDYYASDALWFSANLTAVNTFPEAWFFPGYWAEFGMCTEPSAFGSRMRFLEESLPHAERILDNIRQAGSLTVPDVRTDGLLPFVIARLRNSREQIIENDHQIRFAVSRGPLNIAAFLAGTTELMTAVSLYPDETALLLERITGFVCEWISWQKECFPSINGVLILDDIIGFVGEEEFREFVLPSFRRIFSSSGMKVNFLHNDAAGLITAKYLGDMGVNMFNFSHEHSINEIRKICGPDVVLVGNIPPRDVLAAGTPGKVRSAVEKTMSETLDHNKVIWSAGGGMPQDVPTANIEAFIEAVKSESGGDVE
jgi:uroporphyrinogen-III decarboxylase